MNRRDIAFLLIGLGAGLILSVVLVVEWMTVSYHHMFIMGISWGPSSAILALPFILVAAGSILLYRVRSRA